MCGIFGVIAKKGSSYNKTLLRKTVERIAILSESRGKDSSGLAFRNNSASEFSVFKGPIRISELIRDPKIKDEFHKVLGKENHYLNSPLEQLFAVIGHARLVTNGTQLEDENNQPVIKDGVIGIHNGIIVNIEELWKNNQDLVRQYKIDTEIMLALVKKADINTTTSEFSLSNTINSIFGTASTALLFTYKAELLLATNNGSLYYMTNFKDLLIFASEYYILNKLSKKKSLMDAIGESQIIHLSPNTGLQLKFNTFNFHPFKFTDTVPSGIPIKYNNKEFGVKVIKIGEDKDNRPVIVDLDSIRINSGASCEKNLLQFNIEAIKKLRRCTKCLLPETFPFLDFDEKGVCNYCRNYIQKNQPKPLDYLFTLVDPFKRKDGKPDCIVPYSGGRDSTFTLHFVKETLGLNPLAFTYDWGMVTDLARRNIARVCGTMGVENIIVAADIRRKRLNIKNNIIAWLKYPQLGMIPLFMAGDKFFFYHTNQLKKQTGLRLNIWGANPLENTDFKTGFAGIKPDFNKKRIYSLTLPNQARLFRFVGKNIVASPNYLNSSVLDSLGSFATRFIAPKKDYFHFFDYYKWNENEIETLILNRYHWETAIDTKATWRIGDGTASFYNYIYFTVAGFSENDTFRSNQIREGMMSREKALASVEQENMPRYETIKWYLNILGLDYESIVKAINNIPKLYPL